MPIQVAGGVRRMGDEEFKVRAYEVMRHVFDVHGELGRLFHEKIYQRELASRIADARCEVAAEVRFEDFCKSYSLDLLIGGGAIFELKAVEALAPRHERQLMQYLFLTDLPHGKLVNLRPERVDHKFVNNVLSRAERTDFTVGCNGWEEIDGAHIKARMVALLRDWEGHLVERKMWERNIERRNASSAPHILFPHILFQDLEDRSEPCPMHRAKSTRAFDAD